MPRIVTSAYDEYLTIQIIVLVGGKSDILTCFFAPVLLALKSHGPFLAGIIPFGCCDCRVGPDVEFHHFRIELEPFCKLVLRCKYLDKLVYP